MGPPGPLVRPGVPVSCLKKRTSFRNPRGPFGAAHKIALNRIEQNENSIPESANYFPSATVVRKGSNVLFPTATFIPALIGSRFTKGRASVGRYMIQITAPQILGRRLLPM
jgi:hypothetical protein